MAEAPLPHLHPDWAGAASHAVSRWTELQRNGRRGQTAPRTVVTTLAGCGSWAHRCGWVPTFRHQVSRLPLE